MILRQPLTFLFGAGVSLRNQLYDSGRLKTRELAGPVVSIGNISVGGAGKTPFTILLGELLKARGIVFDILSRGYGRTSSGTKVVDPNGTAREFGDEPLLMARKLAVPVVVGGDRYEAGILAERTHGVRLHLLDDGFQHRRLKRQFDIVLFSENDLRDCLLPAGRLREPFSALERADVIVPVNTDVTAADGTKNVWRVRRAVAELAVSPRPLVFCGIARPQEFVKQLRAVGVEPAGVQFYRDHHAYTEANVAQLLQLRARHQADGFVTTEKDVTNLGPLADALRPLSVASVKMILQGADQCLDFMLQTLQERGKPAT
jgi:tetraacyldisaccharide 4'-kinase